MYILAKNNVVEKYPYTTRDLKRDNPSTGFPKNLSDDMLAAWSVYSVVGSNPVSYDPNVQNIAEGDPVLVDGQWQQTWVVTDATPEEVTQRAEQQANDMRNKRNHLLADSDWTQVADAPVNTTLWATYRQALRDITVHPNFPYLLDDDWPVKPD